MVTFDDAKSKYYQLLEVTKFKQVDKNEDVIILIHGKRVSLSNNKRVWPTMRAAKCALKMYLRRIRMHYSVRDIGYVHDHNIRESYTITNEAFDKAEDEWIQNNVAFVPLSLHRGKATK